MIDRADRRWLGVGLVAFGVTGLGLIAAALVLVLGSLSSIDDAATGFERQKSDAVAMLRPASAALSDAADGAANATASLDQAAAAADRGAALTSRLATSFDGLASLETLEVLGVRPFGGAAGQFSGVGTDARALASDLTATAGSLRANATDGASVAADLRALAAQLDRLEASLGATSGSGATGMHLPILAVEIVLLGLLGWMAVPALGSFWLGWRLARRTRA